MKKRQVAADPIDDVSDVEDVTDAENTNPNTAVATTSLSLEKVTAKRSQLNDIIAGIFSGNSETELISTARCRYDV